MVTLEVGLDASKLVGGSRDAFSALVNISNAARSAIDGIEGLGGNAGAFSKMSGVLSKLSPWLTAATAAITAITLTMKLFESGTDRATDAINRQGTALDKLVEKSRLTNEEVRIRQSYGQQLPNASANATIDTLTAIRQDRTRSEFSATDAANLFGVSEQDLRYILAKNGLGESALEVQQFKYGTPGNRTRFSQQQFGREDVLRAGETLLRQRNQSPLEIQGGTYPGQAQATNGFSLRDTIGEPFNGVRISQEDQSRVNIENMQRAMRDIERSSQRVGQYLGDAATALVTGAASWRDIAQQVIQDMIRAGLTQGFTSISQSFLSGFAATPAQTTAPT